VASDINNLGSVLKELGDLPGAKTAFERALRIGEKAFGPEHHEVALYVNNLGSTLGGLGDLPGAKAAFERALAIFRKFLGDDHPNTKLVRGNLELLAQARE
jgi:tetratricopeptide (TPR) repeat protein